MSTIRELFKDKNNDDEGFEDDKSEINFLEDDIIKNSGLSLGEMTKKIATEKNISEIEAVRGIYQTLEDGKAELVEPSLPKSIISYFSPKYNLWFWLIIGIIIVLLYSIYLMPQTYPIYYLRILIGSFFILYIPGYALLKALYFHQNEIEKLDRFGLNIVMSIIIVPLMGLLLNYTPWGIKLDPAIITLSIFTITFSLIAVYRRYNYLQLTRNE